MTTNTGNTGSKQAKIKEKALLKSQEADIFKFDSQVFQNAKTAEHKSNSRTGP